MWTKKTITAETGDERDVVASIKEASGAEAAKKKTVGKGKLIVYPDCSKITAITPDPTSYTKALTPSASAAVTDTFTVLVKDDMHDTYFAKYNDYCKGLTVAKSGTYASLVGTAVDQSKFKVTGTITIPKGSTVSSVAKVVTLTFSRPGPGKKGASVSDSNLWTKANTIKKEFKVTITLVAAPVAAKTETKKAEVVTVVEASESVAVAATTVVGGVLAGSMMAASFMAAPPPPAPAPTSSASASGSGSGSQNNE